jgi:hypothetical protein
MSWMTSTAQEMHRRIVVPANNLPPRDPTPEESGNKIPGQNDRDTTRKQDATPDIETIETIRADRKRALDRLASVFHAAHRLDSPECLP